MKNCKGMKFKWDPEYGEGEVAFGHDFNQASPAMQADVIYDWIADLELRLESAINRYHSELTRASHANRTR